MTIPSIEEIRKNGNALIRESSTYLQQHAHNPVYWYPWGDEALNRAVEEDKPIFLSIGYSSCHWCHVMEEKVFERDEIAKYMNENYICIKVDREERPDLDSVYMAAVQAMTKNGGWPLSAFLLPNLKPFYGGTYFPPDQFVKVIERAFNLFKAQRDKLTEQGEAVQRYIDAVSNLGDGNEILSDDQVQAIVDKLLQHVDYEWGGFRSQMKFPTPLRWAFLLHRYRKHGGELLEKALRITLDRINEGGIHDQLGGGFHRYSVDSEWTVPHFEQMLYDNAQLASLYLEAAAVFKSTEYRNVARSTLDFMISDFLSEEGGFYASWDADSEGGEGLYYIWTPDLIKEVCGEEEGEAVCRLLGVTENGNFGGVNVLTRRITEKKLAELEMTREEALALLDKWRGPLRESRGKRIMPNLDQKIVTSWNGLAISAFSKGYELLGDLQYMLTARQTADFLWKNHWNTETGLLRASTEDMPSVTGVLDDYAFFTNGLIDLFTASGETKYLERALELVEYIRKHFANPDGGAYFHTPDTIAQPMGRRIEYIDSVEPSGNALLMVVYLKLAALRGEEEYRDEVRRVIAGFTNVLERSGQELATWLDAIGLYHGPFHEVVIVGKPDAPETSELLKAYREAAPYNAVLSFVPGDEATEKLVDLLPPVNGKTTIDGKPATYVCRFGACDEPVFSGEALNKKFG